MAGEAPSCTVIGTVRDDLDTLTRNVLNMTCDRCGLVDNLSHLHRQAIGESRIILP